MRRFRPHYGIIFTIITLTLLVTLGATADVPTANSVTRTLEPVVIKGDELPAYLGAPVADIFLYAYRSSNWVQLPAQVDEVNADGEYVAMEDGLLDGNDEIVFMARDLGDSPDGAAPITGDDTTVVSWYEASITDPTRPGDQGWACIVRSDSILPVATDDYVRFDESAHRIVGSNYAMGFATPDAWLDYMALGTSTVDILDRAPKVRFCKGALCFNENWFPDAADGLVKDGPVRVIVRDGRIVAYGWSALSLVSVTLPSALAPDFVRFSTDYNANITGATFYNDSVPEGVAVDGLPDTVPSTPFCPWTQISHSTGTLIQVYDVSGAGGTATNYYVDDATLDSRDTGDKKRYGDAGVQVAEPNLAVSLRTSFFLLDGAQPNVGGMHADYVNQPLQTTIQWRELFLDHDLYLPLALR